MSLNFDITGTPPALADITQKREQAVTERAIFRKKNIRFMIGMAFTVVIYMAIMIIFVIPQMKEEDPSLGILTYFFPYLTFAIFIVGNHLHIKNIEKPSKQLDKTIEELNEVTDDEVNSVIDDKEHPTEIASYLERVTAQGRSLVRAEIDAIQKWYESYELAKSS